MCSVRTFDISTLIAIFTASLAPSGSVIRVSAFMMSAYEIGQTVPSGLKGECKDEPARCESECGGSCGGRLRRRQDAENRTPVKQESGNELKRVRAQQRGAGQASISLRHLREASDAPMELLRACGGARSRGHPPCAADAERSITVNSGLYKGVDGSVYACSSKLRRRELSRRWDGEREDAAQAFPSRARKSERWREVSLGKLQRRNAVCDWS